MEKQHIIGVYGDEDKFINALRELKEKNMGAQEVYTPYPIHEVFTLLERKTRFTYAAFVYGLAAVIGVLSFLYYTSVIDWPLNFGGKPTNAFPSFIVIILVLTILSITILSLFTFSIVARLYPGKAAKMPDFRATDDKYVLVVEKTGDGQRETTVKSIIREAGAEEIYEKETE